MITHDVYSAQLPVVQLTCVLCYSQVLMLHTHLIGRWDYQVKLIAWLWLLHRAQITWHCVFPFRTKCLRTWTLPRVIVQYVHVIVHGCIYMCIYAWCVCIHQSWCVSLMRHVITDTNCSKLIVLASITQHAAIPALRVNWTTTPLAANSHTSQGLDVESESHPVHLHVYQQGYYTRCVYVAVYYSWHDSIPSWTLTLSCACSCAWNIFLWKSSLKQAWL